MKKKKLGIEEISKAIGSPKSFTAKILQALTKNNSIISSVRGPNGGFFLTAHAKKLPVRSVLQAMGEDEILDKCVLGLKLCSEIQPCPLHTQYKPIRKQLSELFISKTISELASEIKDGVVFMKKSSIGHLFPDTEFTKNIIQLVFVGYFTGNFSQIIKAAPDI